MKKAFTLAEVLITLGIIGVVAAMTLPSLITNHQKQKTVTQLKKIYSTFSQALVKSQYDNGSSNEWQATQLNSSYEENLAYIEKYWKPYLNIAKDCKSMIECGYNITNFKNIVKLTGIGYGQLDNIPGFILNDGTYFYIRPYSVSSDLPELQLLLIDINGPQNPNTLGKDVFQFRININKGTITGYDVYNKNGEVCTKEKITQQPLEYSRACGGKIMRDGWQIAPDYPW